MKRYFHKELSELKNKLILIGEKSHGIATLAIDGLLENDLEKVNQAYGMDDYVDDLEMDIAHSCIRYMSLRSPVSSDLRLLLVALKASKDFERIGDEAHSIAQKSCKLLTTEGSLKNSLDLREMGTLTCQLVKDSITCFVEEDIDKAFLILKKDREIDTINQKHFDTLSDEAMRAEMSDASRFNTMLISKSIERIGDHAKNIAREVIFLLNGDQ
jgi:phosphate transport system protein